jgi:DNA-binding GntR family transcriptional regulator
MAGAAGGRSTSRRSDTVYDVLREAMVEQALTPGTKLQEDALGAHFGVSRTIIRAALQRLAGDGLVEMKAKRSATVARPSLDEARSVFEVRRSLESEVVRLVVARWQPAFQASLEHHIIEEEQAARQGDGKLTVRLAAGFHVTLAGMAGNPLLTRYVNEVVSRCSLILAVFGRPHQSECAIDEHRQILAALLAGDASAAVHAMHDHVALVEQRGLIETEEAPDIGSILEPYWPGASEAVPVKPSSSKATPDASPQRNRKPGAATPGRVTKRGPA